MSLCSQSFDDINDSYYDYLHDFIESGSLNQQMEQPEEQPEEQDQKVEEKPENIIQSPEKIKEQPVWKPISRKNHDGSLLWCSFPDCRYCCTSVSMMSAHLHSHSSQISNITTHRAEP